MVEGVGDAPLLPEQVQPLSVYQLVKIVEGFSEGDEGLANNLLGFYGEIVRISNGALKGVGKLEGKKLEKVGAVFRHAISGGVSNVGLQLSLKERKEEKGVEWNDKVLVKATKNCLNYLQFLEGKKEVERVSAEDLKTIVEKVWGIVMKDDEDKKKLSFDLKESEGFELMVNGFEIKNLVFELIRNAVDHGKINREGKGVKWIMKTDNEVNEIKVVDDGKGFDPKMLEKVEGVSRALLSGESTKDGGGLGLAQIKEMVESLGGEIKVGNKKDFGGEIEEGEEGGIVEMRWPVKRGGEVE